VGAAYAPLSLLGIIRLLHGCRLLLNREMYPAFYRLHYARRESLRREHIMGNWRCRSGLGQSKVLNLLIEGGIYPCAVII